MFVNLENEVEFPGGAEAWGNYLRESVKANMPVDEGWKAETYKVMERFVVAKDGSVSNVITENYAGSKTAEMYMDIIKKGPKWLPGKQNDLVVTSIKWQPITFVVAE